MSPPTDRPTKSTLQQADYAYSLYLLRVAVVVDLTVASLAVGSVVEVVGAVRDTGVVQSTSIPLRSSSTRTTSAGPRHVVDDHVGIHSACKETVRHWLGWWGICLLV